jgi:hypothetical protein
MSTTTSGPFTPVVRRTIPSGSVNGGVPAAGVSHPFSHVPDGDPLVLGGIVGRAGGVGDALVDPGVTGATAVDVDGASDAGASPSHAASDPASTQTDIKMRNLRKRNAPEYSGTTRGYR